MKIVPPQSQKRPFLVEGEDLFITEVDPSLETADLEREIQGFEVNPDLTLRKDIERIMHEDQAGEEDIRVIEALHKAEKGTKLRREHSTVRNSHLKPTRAFLNKKLLML